MTLRFCILNAVGTGEIAVNPVSVTAVRADGADTVVTYVGGEAKVTGGVPEVILRLLEADRSIEKRVASVPELVRTA